MYKKILYIVGVAVGLLTACTPKDSYDEEYDIKYDVARITSLSTDTAYIGETITITGVNFDDPTLQVFVGAYAMPIVANSVTPTTVKVVVPRTALKAKISVITKFTSEARIDNTSPNEFVPLYPHTVITGIPDTLFNKGMTFDVIGENMDMITKIAIGEDTLMPVTITDINIAKFDLSGVNISKKITAINFVTKAKTEFTDKEVTVMEDLPKIEIFAQFPDVAKRGEKLQLVFDKPEFGKFITKINVEYVTDTVFNADNTISKLNLSTIAVTDFNVDLNKINLTLPDTTLNGVVRILGLYKLSKKHVLLIE